MTTVQRVPEWPVHYRLKLAIDTADVDPRELAAELGLSPAAIYGYLRGEHKPKRPTLRWIAERTDVPLWWLEGAEQPDPVTTPLTAGSLVRRRSARPKVNGWDTTNERLVTGQRLTKAA